MGLDKLVGVTLDRIAPDASVIKRLISAAERNTADACVTDISAESRFDIAYKAIMQLANVALQANGYRTMTGKPGHHMTMIQSLSQTVDLDSRIVMVLDTLRKQRNVSDYSGDIIPESAADECISQARNLLNIIRNWLKVNKPELIE